MSLDTPPITPQQYEVLHGGGAEAAEIAQQRLSRRRFLRRSMLAVWGLSATSAVAGALYMLYPNLAGQFGAPITVGQKSDFPAAKTVDEFAKGSTGVFYNQAARAYIIHMAADFPFLLSGATLAGELDFESILKDSDGSYWIALYQKCVHLGCTVPFRDDCSSFKCPCHGSHYAVTGEWIDGPAPISLNRFILTFSGQDVIVNTGEINTKVPHPDNTTRLVDVSHLKLCSAS
jgi:cytochrome b6-f complex iron-sulfur subunit